MSGLQVDTENLRQFEAGLDPQHPERGPIPARVLGYGEISTVFEIQADGLRGLAFKRLPLFRDWVEVERYRAVYEEYNRLLQEDIGLRIPPNTHAAFPGRDGRPVFYIIQQQLPSSSIGSRALHTLSEEAVLALVHLVLGELRKVWDYNRRQDRVRVSIDGQISNWAVEGLSGNALEPDACLSYVDTSTPLFRVQGVEQLDVELFLRSAPAFLVWILRLLYLKDVVNRYYDLHLVAVDLAANFFKEQRADLVPSVVGVLDDFFAHEAADLGTAPVSEVEVRSYYKEDASIWSLYLSLRRLDRFLRTRLLGRPYPYILPGKINR